MLGGWGSLLDKALEACVFPPVWPIWREEFSCLFRLPVWLGVVLEQLILSLCWFPAFPALCAFN